MAKKHLTAGAVLFRQAGPGPLFLVIRNSKGHWDFPKGHIEAGETRAGACRREVREETGITRFNFVPGFSARRSWAYRENGLLHKKECFFYLGKCTGGRVRLSSEHIRAEWVTLKRGLQLLKYPGQRSLLRLAGRRAGV